MPRCSLPSMGRAEPVELRVARQRGMRGYLPESALGAGLLEVGQVAALGAGAPGRVEALTQRLLQLIPALRNLLHSAAQRTK